MTTRDNTVQLSLKGKAPSAVEILARLSTTSTILHFEITSASLEDVFLELLGKQSAGGNQP